jgi:hypothetical protein
MVSGGPDGELGASLRYLSQRYAMPYAELKGLLTDIGTSGIRMFHSCQAKTDKPYRSRLLIHSIQTTDKLSRYTDNSETSIIQKIGETERVINLFIA